MSKWPIDSFDNSNEEYNFLPLDSILLIYIFLLTDLLCVFYSTHCSHK